MSDQFTPQPYPLVAVDPATQKPYIVVGWLPDSTRIARVRPVLVPLRDAGEPRPSVQNKSYDWLLPGEDVGLYLKNRWAERGEVRT